MTKNSHFIAYCVILLQIWGAFCSSEALEIKEREGGRGVLA